MKRPAEIIATEKKGPAKLSKLDREIINILSINSRTPLSQIAKSLKTSPEVVSYRYNNLRKKQVITDVFTIVDPKVLGIRRYNIYLQFHALSQLKMKSIIQDFLKNKFVNWIIETGGKWELILMIETLHEEKYDAILESIISPNKHYLNDYMVTIVKEFVHKSPRYIKGFKPKSHYQNKIRFPYDKELNLIKKKKHSFDEKDILLLKLLHEDSRLSLTELGKKLRLSRDSVDYRIKKLINGGIIKGFILRLNYYLLEFQYTTTMLKLRSISQKRKNEFLNFVYADDRFYALIDQIGTWDISLMMFFTDAKDLRDFIIGLKEKFSDVIHSHESVIHFDQYYYTYLCEAVVQELISRHERLVSD